MKKYLLNFKLAIVTLTIGKPEENNLLAQAQFIVNYDRTYRS